MPDARTPLETPRLVLEPLAPAHAEPLYPLLLDERLYTFIPQDPPVSLKALIHRHERLAVGRSPEGTEIWLNWAARERRSGALIGAFQATIYPDHSAEIAYIVFSAHQGLGYATEACTRILTHLATDHDVRTARADIDTRNVASIALIESLSFTRVKFTPDADTFKGSTSHEYRYERHLRPATDGPAQATSDTDVG